MADTSDDLSVIIAVCLGLALLVIFGLYSRSKSNESSVVLEKPKPKELKIVTMDEVAKHNKRDDAWIVIRDKSTKQPKVYDITTYIEEHPGGDSIMNNVGGDSTEGFHGPQHPASVFVLVEEYLIGTLAE